jgi:hypothetical protein
MASSLGGDAVDLLDVFHEVVEVADQRREPGRIPAGTWRSTVPARVPGIEHMVGQIQLVDEVGHAAAVLVAAVEQDHGASGPFARRRPAAVEQVDPVVGGELAFDEPSNRQSATPAASSSPWPTRRSTVIPSSATSPS